MQRCSLSQWHPTSAICRMYSRLSAQNSYRASTAAAALLVPLLPLVVAATNCGRSAWNASTNP